MTQLGQYSGNVRDLLGVLATTQPASPSTFYRASQPRFGLYDSVSDSGSIALLTQVMTAVPVLLAAGDVVTNVSFITGTTAGATMTNWWMALYDSQATPALLAQTADQTSGAIAAFTVITKPLATAQTISKTGVYWVAVMVKATTVPTLLGTIGAPPVATGERNLAVTSGASLTTTAPATLATPALQRFAPYIELT